MILLFLHTYIAYHAYIHTYSVRYIGPLPLGSWFILLNCVIYGFTSRLDKLAIKSAGKTLYYAYGRLLMARYVCVYIYTYKKHISLDTCLVLHHKNTIYIQTYTSELHSRFSHDLYKTSTQMYMSFVSTQTPDMSLHAYTHTVLHWRAQSSCPRD